MGSPLAVGMSLLCSGKAGTLNLSPSYRNHLEKSNMSLLIVGGEAPQSKSFLSLSIKIRC